MTRWADRTANYPEAVPRRTSGGLRHVLRLQVLRLILGEVWETGR